MYTHTHVNTPPPPALLGLHPGDAHQPGQHDSGPHPHDAADVRRHGTRRHGDGRQRAGGLPAEEGPGPPADLLHGRLQTAQSQLRGRCLQVLSGNTGQFGVTGAALDGSSWSGGETGEGTGTLLFIYMKATPLKSLVFKIKALPVSVWILQ